MSINCRCPQCGTAMSVPNADAGLSVQCKNCRHSFTAPPFVPEWKREPDETDKRPKWARTPDDIRDADPPNLRLRWLGIGLIVWGVFTLFSGGLLPSPDAGEQAGRSIGGCCCFVFSVCGGIVLVVRSRGRRSE